MRESPLGDGRESGVDWRFQVATGLYGGVLVAGVVASVAAWIDASSTVLAGTYTTGLLVGIGLGIVVATVGHDLPARLGRTAVRRLAVVAPAGLFGAVAAASWFVSVDAAVVTVAVGTALGLLVTGHVLGTLAGNRYVDAVVTDGPIATWDWEPPGTPRLDGALFLAWSALAVAAVVGENWLTAAGWTTIAVLWAVSCVVEGRWQLETVGDRPEIRVHEIGLVKRRPYNKSFVPWHAVDHVRVREDELVLDRGFVDVRFDRDELGDLEAVLDVLERQLADEDVTVLSPD